MTVSSAYIAWDSLDYTALTLLWDHHDTKTIAGVLGRGRSTGAIWRASKKLGLGKSKALYRFPSGIDWTRIATEEAVQAKINPVRLLAGDKSNAYAWARWRAWRRLKALSPRYSNHSVGKCTGHDHVSVRNGLLRLDALEKAGVKSNFARNRKRKKMTFRTPPQNTEAAHSVSR